MSRLVEKLQLTSRGTAQPLGFRGGAATSAQRSPAVLLIASLAGGDANALADGKENADAVLLDKAEGQTADALGEAIWGVKLVEPTEKQIRQLKEMGCDFIIFDPATAPLALLREDDMGKIVEVDPLLGDGLIRGVDRLPVDAVLVGGDSGLSVHRLLVCQHVGNLARKPVITPVPLDITTEALEELRDAGTLAVIAPAGAAGKKELSGLKKALDSLPPPSRARRERIAATLPYAGTLSQEEEEEEEEEFD